VGVNNRARRAAKKRRRAQQDRTRASGGYAAGYASADGVGAGEWKRSEPSPEAVRGWLADAVAGLSGARKDAAEVADWLQGPEWPVPGDVTAETLLGLLDGQLRRVLVNGWAPTDLGEVVRRKGDPAGLPALVALLGREVARHPSSQVASQWRDDLTELEVVVAAVHPGTGRLDDLAAVLALCALLGQLHPLYPLFPAPGAAASSVRSDDLRAAAAGRADSKVLAKVRALLAKAESTEFPEEAETLSAKAQELISRYALERLVTQKADDRPAVLRRRIWIDAPYVAPKAALLQAVATANSCRVVLDDFYGYVTVLGEESDIEAVELLTTSLLVQADAAMLRHGSQSTRDGRSRTAAFRRAFLLSYAHRIGERLAEAQQDAVAALGRGGELVPLLTAKTERVEDAFTEAFPRVRSRTTSVSDYRGWAAGRAAADQAVLRERSGLAEAAG
jgi:hypothetical protein